tara:strand:+ start:780 stop:884 length:105 start_codon:yes stop_codon:yes gene_type:complete
MGMREIRLGWVQEEKFDCLEKVGKNMKKKNKSWE